MQIILEIQIKRRNEEGVIAKADLSMMRMLVEEMLELKGAGQGAAGDVVMMGYA